MLMYFNLLLIVSKTTVVDKKDKSCGAGGEDKKVIYVRILIGLKGKYIFYILNLYNHKILYIS